MSDLDVGVLRGGMEFDLQPLNRGEQQAIAIVQRIGASAAAAATQGSSAIASGMVSALGSIGPAVGQAGQQSGAAFGAGITTAAVAALGSLPAEARQTGTQAGNQMGAGIQAGVQQGVTQGLAGAPSGAAAGGQLGAQIGGAAQSAVAAGVQAGVNDGTNGGSAAGGQLGAAVGNAAQGGVQAGVAAGVAAGTAGGNAQGGQLGAHIGNAAQPGVASGIQQGVQQGTQGGAQAGSGFGSSFGDGLKAALGAAGIGAALTMAMDANAANSKLKAQLGLTVEEAGRLGKDAGTLYSHNYGEGLSDVNDAIKSVILNIGGMRTASDSDLQSITGQVLSLASTFDQDLGGVTKAVGQMMKTGLAPDAQSALDILAKGFQAGNDKAEDLLDTVNEYGVQFKKAGIDGQTAMGLIQQGLQGGARDADLVADQIKEIGIRLLDGSAAQGLTQLGLNAQTTLAEFSKGGDSAKGALDEIFDRVKALGGASQNMGALSQIAGTQVEDLGSAFDKLDVSAAAKSLGDFSGAASDIDSTVGGTAQGTLATFGRTVASVGLNFGQDLLPLLNPVMTGIGDITGVIGDAVTAFGKLPQPIINGAVAFGGLLLLKGPITAVFRTIQANAAMAAIALSGSGGIAGAAGKAVGGLSRVAGFMAGPWGLALMAAGVALTTFIGQSDDATIVTGDFTSALDDNTGALTKNAPAVVAKALADDGALDRAKHAGVNTGLFTAAVMGNTDALAKSKDAIAAHAVEILKQGGATEDGAHFFSLYEKAAKDSGLSLQDYTKQVLASGDAREQFARIADFSNIDDPNDIQSATLAWSVLTAETDKFASTRQTVKDAIDADAQAQKIAAAAALDRQAKELGLVTALSKRQDADKAAGVAMGEWSAGVVKNANDADAYAASITALGGAQDNAKAHSLELGAALATWGDAKASDMDAMAASVQSVGDQSSRSATEVQAFAIAIDKATGRNVPLELATKNLNDQTRALAATFGDADATAKANAASLVTATGVINTTSEAGSKLYDSVSNYAQAYDTSTTAAMDATGAYSSVADKVKAAQGAADTARASFIAQAQALGLSPPVAAALADKMGILEGKKLTPKILGLSAQDDATPKVKALDKQQLSDKRFQVEVNGIPDAEAELANLMRDRHASIIVTTTGVALAGKSIDDQVPHSANGNIFAAGRALHFANGGAEQHNAQISQPGGPVRVWGEPETKGEIYAPLNPSKRGRTDKIMAQGARMLGGRYFNAKQAAALHFANGGIALGLLQGRTPGSLTASQSNVQAGLGQLGQALTNALATRDTQRSALGAATAHTAAATDGVAKAEAALAAARKSGSKAAIAAATTQVARSKATQAQAKTAEAAARKTYDATGKNIAAATALQKTMGPLRNEQYKLAAAIDSTAAKATAARAALASTLSAKASLADSISGGVQGIGGGILGFAAQRNSVGDILNGLRANAATGAAYTGNLATLKSKGLGAGLLQQLGNGSDDAIKQAAILAGGSKADIAQANKYTAQIAASGKTAGALVAGAVFDPLIKSQQLAVQSLDRTTKAIQQQADAIGKTLSTVIPKALSGLHVTLTNQQIALAVRAGEKALKTR